MAHHIADENTGRRIRQRSHIEEIPANRTRWKVAVGKPQPRRGGIRRAREEWILLGDDRLLNLASHPQVFLHLLILGPQLFTVLCELHRGPAQALLGSSAQSDVP